MAVAAAVLIAGTVHAIKTNPPPSPMPAISTPSTPSPPHTENAYWGPRLWRIFHTLAEYSDRRDVSHLWLNVMRATAQTMPCAKCRTHLTEYLRTHSMFRSSPITPPKDIQTTIRRDLHVLHNSVNARNKTPQFDSKQLALTYGIKPRPERLYEVQVLYNELKNAWTPMLHTRIHPAAFSQWKQALELLIAIIAGGPHK